MNTKREAREFSRLSDDPKDPLWRLRIEEEFYCSGLITITEEGISSRSVTHVATDVRAALDLTEGQARWLHERLGELLAVRCRCAEVPYDYDEQRRKCPVHGVRASEQ